MNIPFHAMHFVIYEQCQSLMNPEQNYDPKSHILAGGIAGGLAAALTNPLDVCKTLINTQEHGATLWEGTITGFRKATRTVYKLQGVRGFFKGLVARVLFVAPGTAIAWTGYEFVKYVILGVKDSENCDGRSFSKV